MTELCKMFCPEDLVFGKGKQGAAEEEEPEGPEEPEEEPEEMEED